jgi:hypothetical protein
VKTVTFQCDECGEVYHRGYNARDLVPFAIACEKCNLEGKDGTARRRNLSVSPMNDEDMQRVSAATAAMTVAGGFTKDRIIL